jgi:hypothetical protein
MRRNTTCIILLNARTREGGDAAPDRGRGHRRHRPMSAHLCYGDPPDKIRRDCRIWNDCARVYCKSSTDMARDMRILWISIFPPDDPTHEVRRAGRRWRPPLSVKPCVGGAPRSSCGYYKVTKRRVRPVAPVGPPARTFPPFARAPLPSGTAARAPEVTSTPFRFSSFESEPLPRVVRDDPAGERYFQAFAGCSGDVWAP